MAPKSALDKDSSSSSNNSDIAEKAKQQQQQQQQQHRDQSANAILREEQGNKNSIERPRSRFARASSTRSLKEGTVSSSSAFSSPVVGGGNHESPCRRHGVDNVDDSMNHAHSPSRRAHRPRVRTTIRANRKKSKSASETIQAWHDHHDTFATPISNMVYKPNAFFNQHDELSLPSLEQPSSSSTTPSTNTTKRNHNNKFVARAAALLADIPELATAKYHHRHHRRQRSNLSRMSSTRSFEDDLMHYGGGGGDTLMVDPRNDNDSGTTPIDGGGDTSAGGGAGGVVVDRRALRRANRRKTKSASDTIQAWREDLFSIRNHPSKQTKQKNHHVDSTNDMAERRTTTITPVDLDMLRSLEHDYSAAAQRNAAQDRAQRIWACRAGLSSVLFMVVYLVIGVLVFLQLADDDDDWNNLDTFLFAVYTSTTVGFGHITPPDRPAYYFFNTIYLMVGVAAMAIMVAQVFQWMELEAARARDLRRARELADRSDTNATEGNNKNKSSRRWTLMRFWRWTDRFLPWFQETNQGRVLSVVFTLTFIGLIGAVPIGLVEGWSFLEMVYFACVAMTTVGYGDLVPETRAGIKICLAWLPLSVIFSSVYMGSVATWYLNLSARGIQSIQTSLSADIHSHRGVNPTLDRSPPERLSKVQQQAALGGGKVDGDNDDQSDEVSSLNSEMAADVELSDQGSLDDSVVMEGDDVAPLVVFENINSTLTTMQDVIDAIHKNTTDHQLLAVTSQENKTVTDSMKFLSLQDDEADKPCFALRVLVKERMASIIAYDICGGAHHVDVKDTFIVVRVGQWKEVVNKWLVPSGAWKAFRAAALEAMMLAGERALIREGPAALFRLSPDEFHSMFSPLVAAMGDPDTLEGWLRSTDAQAQKLFQQHRNQGARTGKQHKNLTVEGDVVQLPKGAGLIFQS